MGAIILHVEPIAGKSRSPYNKMSDITTENIFPPLDVPADVKSMKFPFIKVENLDWGRESKFHLFRHFLHKIVIATSDFKGFEFYNMTGFHVYFDDDAMDRVVHIQAWTLGLGETVSGFTGQLIYTSSTCFYTRRDSVCMSIVHDEKCTDFLCPSR